VLNLKKNTVGTVFVTLYRPALQVAKQIMSRDINGNVVFRKF